MGMPANVKVALANLDPAAQEACERDYMARKKSPLIAYVLWFVGLHYLYLGKFGLQFLFLDHRGRLSRLGNCRSVPATWHGRRGKTKRSPGT